MTCCRRLAAFAAGLTCWLAATPATAAVITSAKSIQPGFSEQNPKTGPVEVPPSTIYLVAIAAHPGETNAITIELTPDALVVRDAAGASPGQGCKTVDATTVRCATPPEPGTEIVYRGIGKVTLDDGDDSVALPDGASSASEVDAGSGNDTVTGALRAFGGPGDDRLEAQIAHGGDGDDHVTAVDGDGDEGNDVLGATTRRSQLVRLRGGPGADVLTGGDYTDLYRGTGDTLDGGDGNDRLAGGAGDDQLFPGPGADVLDGGAGVDFASFAYASAPVRADLAVPGIDPTGEGDAMTAVESLEGGSGDDEIAGTERGEALVGGEGDDRLSGRGGRDVIAGGPGADVIHGGDGADDLTAGSAFVDFNRRESGEWETDLAADAVTGGSGGDTVRIGSLDRGDAGSGHDLLVVRGRPAATSCGRGGRDRFDGVRLPRDCERFMWFGSEVGTARMKLRGRTLSIHLPGYFGGRFDVRVRVDGRRVARGRIRIPFQASRTLRMRVTPRGARTLRRARTVRVNVVGPGPDGRERDSALLPRPR